MADLGNFQIKSESDVRRFETEMSLDERLPEKSILDVFINGSIRISYAHGPTGRIPTAAARTARGVGCLGSTAR